VRIRCTRARRPASPVTPTDASSASADPRVDCAAVSTRHPQWLPTRLDAPGVVLSFLIGGASWGLAQVVPPTPFLSDILIALVAGALILNTPLRRPLRLELPGDEREPDRYAHGLRFVGKWVLRLSIILMGLKVQTQLIHAGDLALIVGVILCALPSAFFVAH